MMLSLAPSPFPQRTQFALVAPGRRLGDFDFSALTPLLTTGLNIAMQERVNYLKKKADDAAREAAERQQAIMVQAAAQQQAAQAANAAAFNQAASGGGGNSLWAALNTPAGAAGGLGVLAALIYFLARR